MALGLALGLLACGSAGAAEVSYEDGVAVRVDLLDLKTDSGRERIRTLIVDAARTYCRAVPPGITTVAACRRDIEAAMWGDLADKTRDSIRAGRIARDGITLTLK